MLVVFHKILVPYDGSAASNKALSSTFEIAKMSEELERVRKRGGVISVIVLHVIQEIPVPPNYIGSPLMRLSEKTGESITIREYLKEVYQDMRASAVKMLDQKIREHKINEENMKVRPKVTFGLPADKIMEMATEENVDLIVIGTIGLKGISKIKALGSVARNISERAKCPVMLVR
jgi:nucleotide-binding universal stress UspA family protein